MRAVLRRVVQLALPVQHVRSVLALVQVPVVRQVLALAQALAPVLVPQLLALNHFCR